MPQPKANIPANWPADLVYLGRPHYSPKISTSLLTQKEPLSYNQASASTFSSSSGAAGSLPVLPAAATCSPSPLVRISRITAAHHPAYGQHGLFASRALAPDSFVLCYLGWTHLAEESDPQSSYDLALDRDLGIAVDATRMGNEARFINDYRGVRPEGPNAEFRDVLVRVGNGLVERRMAVFVKAGGKGKGKKSAKKAQSCGIAKNEEIVVSYGKGFWAHQTSDEDPGGGVDTADKENTNEESGRV